MRAREYFERVKRAAVIRERICEKLERMRSSAELRVQTYSDAGGHASDVEPVVDLVAQEMMLRELQHSYDPILDDASAVLFGADGRGGVAKGCGEAEAVAIHTIYCELGDDAEAAKRCECTPDWARHLCERGFRWIDSQGFEQLLGRLPIV